MDGTREIFSMPRRRKTVPRVVSKKTKKIRKRVRKPRSMMGVSRISSASMGLAYRQYAEMVVNPCMGPLVRAPGIADGVNVVERQRISLSLNSMGRTSGYIIWFPAWQGTGTYYNPGGSYAPQNCLLFQAPNTTTAPVNSIAFPLGTGAAGGLYENSGFWVTDPSWAQVNSGSFSRSRCTSACMQLEFLGALSSAAGQVCMVSNFSFDALIATTVGSLTGAVTLPTVDSIFSYAATRERLDLNGHEVIFRPSDMDCKLRGDSGSLFNNAQAHNTVPDGLFWGGSAGSSASLVGATDPREAVAICIAWRSMPAVADTLTANLIKISEYETAPLLNLVEQPHNPKQSVPGLTISAVVDKLTAMMPRWQVGSVIKNAEAMYRLTTAVRAVTAGRRNAGEALRGLRITDGEL